MPANLAPGLDGAGAWWRAATVLCWVAGIGAQLQQPRLWSSQAYLIVAAIGAACACAAWSLACWRGRWRWRLSMRLAAGLAACALAFAFAGWRAGTRLADALAPAWEGCDIEVVGVVDEMPQVADDGAHFAFVVESALAAGMTSRDLRAVQRLDLAAGRPLSGAVLAAEQGAARVRATAGAAGETADDDSAVAAPPAPGAGTPVVPSRIWLSWSRDQRDDRAVARSPAPLRAGQRWRLPVRLRQPHGALNPDGFDAELWLFDQGLRATGTVRGNGQLLDESWAPIENTRQWVRNRLMLGGDGIDAGDAGGASDAAVRGALAALAVGDQAAIDVPVK